MLTSSSIDLAIGRSWIGIYQTTPDREAIVELHPTSDGAVCAPVAGTSEIQLSPAPGLLVTDAVAGRSGRRSARQGGRALARFTRLQNPLRGGNGS